jgi:hypothetical protein
MATIIQEKHRGNHDRHQRWACLERADLFAQYGELDTQEVSQHQAAKVLDVPRSILQAWRLSQDNLDACPTVVSFFHSVAGLAFLYRLVIALHVVCVELGACGIRLMCFMLELTGLNRLGGRRMGPSCRSTVASKMRWWRIVKRRASGWLTRCPPETSR